jgi:drug/metabolite transporter (DMT)-like permease
MNHEMTVLALAILPAWFGFAALALILWGTAGLFQKLSTNHVSAEAALIWLTVGFFLLDPWLLPHRSLASFPMKSLVVALLGGALNTLGSWALLTGLARGGKAAVVVPLTSLYPLVVVIAAPIILRETITRLQGLGVVCALGAVVLFAI